MIKADLISRISEVYPYMSEKNIDKVISIIIDRIATALKNGGRVELRGFGAFSVRKRERTEGRNPKTGEKVMIKAKVVPFFKAGKYLKDLVNGTLDFDEQ